MHGSFIKTKMVKLRSKKQNDNAGAVLSDKTNVVANKATVKGLKPPISAKKNENKKLTTRKGSAIKTSQPCPKPKIVSSEDDENDENLCSNVHVNKNDHSFKKPVSLKSSAIKPRIIQEVPTSIKGKRKRQNGENAPVSKSTKNKIVSKPDNFNVKNTAPSFFGFDDSDLENDQSPCKTELSKFDPSKPYRLALYIKPSRSVRINPVLAKRIQSMHSSLNLTNYSMLNSTMQSTRNAASESVMSPNRTQFKVPFSSTPLPIKKPAVKLIQKKITEVIPATPKRTRAGNADRTFKSYFEKSLTSDEEVSPARGVTEKSTIDDVTCSDDIEESIIPFNTYKKSRRSYIKKSRPPPEPVDEPPSDEIIKSIEKVKKKGKSKKAEKADEEFEKWSQSMNSMFSEVDQFEMSFG